MTSRIACSPSADAAKMSGRYTAFLGPSIRSVWAGGAQIGSNGCRLGRDPVWIGRCQCGIGRDRYPIDCDRSDIDGDEYRPGGDQSGIERGRYIGQVNTRPARVPSRASLLCAARRVLAARRARRATNCAATCPSSSVGGSACIRWRARRGGSIGDDAATARRAKRDPGRKAPQSSARLFTVLSLRMRDSPCLGG